MAFIGLADIDPDEPKFSSWEQDRAAKWLEGWQFARRKYGEREAGSCPHEADYCSTPAQCIERVAWWLRYIREIEHIA